MKGPSPTQSPIPPSKPPHLSPSIHLPRASDRLTELDWVPHVLVPHELHPQLLPRLVDRVLVARKHLTGKGKQAVAHGLDGCIGVNESPIIIIIIIIITSLRRHDTCTNRPPPSSHKNSRHRTRFRSRISRR